MLGKNKDRFL